MVAYIDFFLGGDEKRVDMVSIIQKRFPMCIIFGGDGSYMSPYNVHSDTLLTNLIGQVFIYPSSKLLSYNLTTFSDKSVHDFTAACPSNCMESSGCWFECSVENSSAWIYSLSPNPHN